MALLVGIVLAVMLTAVVSETNYCKICSDHTMCKYTGVGAACKPRLAYGVDKSAKDIILKTHNDLRQKVAQGKETLGAPGPQPNASNMRQLVWDDEIAAVAQRLADQCIFGHDTCRKVSRFSVGQNIAWVGGSKTADWKAQVESWYGEVKLYSKNDINPYKFTMKTGHYTQVVWAETAMVGCGYAKYTKANDNRVQHLYVCNYGPSGNFNTGPLYLVGEGATKCPTGTKPSTTFSGLCA